MKCASLVFVSILASSTGSFFFEKYQETSAEDHDSFYPSDSGRHLKEKKDEYVSMGGAECKVNSDCKYLSQGQDHYCKLDKERKETTSWKTAFMLDSNGTDTTQLVVLDDCTIVARKSVMRSHHLKVDCQDFCADSKADAGKFDADESTMRCYCYELSTCTRETSNEMGKEEYFVTAGTEYKEYDEKKKEWTFIAEDKKKLASAKCEYLDPKTCDGKEVYDNLSAADLGLCRANKMLSTVCIYLALIGYFLLLSLDYIISKYALEPSVAPSSPSKMGGIEKMASARHMKS